jgi:hypothetical protein
VLLRHGEGSSLRNVVRGGRLTPDADVLKMRAGEGKARSALPQITVVIAGIETWRTRHGPQALKEVRTGDMSKSGEDRMAPPEDEFKYDMRGVFRLVVVDEAQSVRGRCSFSHQSVE